MVGGRFVRTRPPHHAAEQGRRSRRTGAVTWRLCVDVGQWTDWEAEESTFGLEIATRTRGKLRRMGLHRGADMYIRTGCGVVPARQIGWLWRAS
jgi:hypothetical protein